MHVNSDTSRLSMLRLRKWKPIMVIAAAAGLLFWIGFRTDWRVCVACGQKETDYSLFGVPLRHTLIRPATFPVKQRPEQEAYCHAGHHLWTTFSRQFVFWWGHEA